MLLEDDRRCHRSFEAMSGVGSDDPSETPKCFASLFEIVGKCVEPLLDRARRSQPLDQAPLRRRERPFGRFRGVSAREGESL